MTLPYFKRCFEYDFWANAKVLDSLEGMPAPPEEAVKKMSHILAAKSIWLSRISTLVPAPDMAKVLSIPECRKLNGELKAHFESFFSSISEGKLSEKVPYKNLKGDTFESLLSDILTQLVTHGPYHRGQIASLINKAGTKPPSTDYIGFVRE
jgi:uncharacterized damage-inducible protein DinB